MTAAATAETRQQEALQDIISKNVLAKLGRPHNYHSTQVRPAGHAHRVNVLTSSVEDECIVPRTVIAASFYVVTDDKGRILTSNPPITKVY